MDYRHRTGRLRLGLYLILDRANTSLGNPVKLPWCRSEVVQLFQYFSVQIVQRDGVFIHWGKSS